MALFGDTLGRQHFNDLVVVFQSHFNFPLLLCSSGLVAEKNNLCIHIWDCLLFNNATSKWNEQCRTKQGHIRLRVHDAHKNYYEPKHDRTRAKKHIVNIITSVTGECPSKTSALLEIYLLQYIKGKNDNYRSILHDNTRHSLQPAAV